MTGQEAAVMQDRKHRRNVLAFFLVFTLVGGAHAAEKEKGIFPYLHAEPVTLFDLGMKSLRRLALETVASVVSRPGRKGASRLFYDPALKTIEIVFTVSIDDDEKVSRLRQRCVELRRYMIRRMFNLGLTDYASPLSPEERVRRRLGAQFAHEPMGPAKEARSLGEQLAPLTFFGVTLATTVTPPVSVTCRGLATDFMGAESPSPKSIAPSR